MTAALFLVPPGALAALRAGAPFRLDGEEGRHAAAVRRIRAGEFVLLADSAGVVARCSVVAAGKDHLELQIVDVESLAPPAVRLGLVQALAKGGRDEQAVEAATEVGVDLVVPWQAGRSIVRWSGERGEKAHRRWVSVAREASKQSRRPTVPSVSPVLATPALAARLSKATLALVLHESATLSLVSVPLPAAGEVLVVVGPEGGIAADELAAFAASGALAVRLGPEVLRASTAGPVALGWLAAATGRWALLN